MKKSSISFMSFYIWTKEMTVLILFTMIIAFSHAETSLPSESGSGFLDDLPNITVYNGDISLEEERAIGFIVPFNYTISNLGSRTASYSLLGPASIFLIDQQTGKIALNTSIDADLVPTPELIYTTVLLVTTNDASSSSATFTLTIVDINDNPPRCNELVYYSNVIENITVPADVQVLNCSDKDLSPNNRNISYNVIQGNASLFSVNGTGLIFTLDVIDYEILQTETLKIEVQDGGSHVVPTVTVIVVVTGVNDNKPVFKPWQPAIPSDRIYLLAENSNLGTNVFTVSATDNDKGVGSDIKYSILVTDGFLSIDGIFTIDPVYGGVTLMRDVDAEAVITEYKITVQASDGTFNVTELITIKITDVNDNVPRFVFIFSDNPDQNLPEKKCTAGYPFVGLMAYDADLSSRDLAIDVIEASDKWYIEQIPLNASVGKLHYAVMFFNRSIDLDKGDQSAFLIQVTVRDNGSPELTGTASFVLYILPDNEYRPQITNITDLSIPENSTVGTILTSISASDNDTGPEGQLIFTITGGNTGNVFGIDSNNNLRTVDKLDRETLDKYMLTIEVEDSGVDKMTSTTYVNITVTNVNEFMPECYTIPMLTTLPENSTVYSSVYQFNCTDKDGDSVTYTVQNPENETFAYSSVFQGLQLIKLVDYESTNRLYTVKVDVSDGTLTTHVAVIVQVTPVNEDAPKFLTNGTVTITENKTPSNPILKYTATDTDYSPHDIVKYSIQPDPVIDSLFSIDPISAEISQRRELDYESLSNGQKFYTLQVIAEDGGGLQGTGTVIVNVLDDNDNAPTCSHELFLVNVSETQTGPYILIPTLNCIDVEDRTSLNFTLTQSPGSHFMMVNQSIELINNTLDYEMATSHMLKVVVSDNGAPPLNTLVVVYVKVINMNDGPPVFPVMPDIPVSESSSIGTIVTVVNATDPDGRDSVFGDPRYSIISGDPSSHFSIGLVSGEITLKKALDFKKQKSYILVIQAIERGGEKSSTASVKVNVIDVNDEIPVCDPNYVFRAVTEKQTANYIIATVNCTDADVGTNLTYSLVNANITLFQMSGDSLTLNAQLDFEAKTFHEFYINVSDGVHAVLVDVSISVGSINEYPPVFGKDPYVVNVSEAANVSSVILTVHANDLDSPLDGNGLVEYSIADDQHFIIDSKSGQIILATHLDWKVASTYTLVVKAHDASLSVNASVHITVLDINNNPPIFSSTVYSGGILETSPAGTSILKVIATDNDDPLTNGNGLVTYAIVGNSSYFMINESTGEIQNSRDLGTDVTGITFFTLNVTAQDSFGKSGSLSATSLVNILVTTINQHQPIFIPDKYFVQVNESQFSFGEVILRVSASDNDNGIDGQFSFDFVSPQKKFSLTQNGSLCEIRLNDILDFDKGDQLFIIEIKVTDKGNPAKSSTATVNIRVDDVNDNPPVCTSIFYLAKVEGSNDSHIVNLHCSDADQSNNLTYSVLRVTPNNATFEISSSGNVSVKSPLDYEISDFFEIHILVQDDKPPVHNATVIVNLKVKDINDNNPSFHGNFAFAVYENETVNGRTLFQANATANDGPTDVVTYSLLDRTYFDISPTTGEISIRTSALDADTLIGLYTMTVCATDTPNPVSRKVCQNINVTTLDVNDNVPVFNPSIYSAAVKEDVAVGAIIVTVTATDKDVSLAFRTIYYSIVGGDSDGKFSVDNNGSVRINSTLDYETKTNYSLLIQASDTLNTVNVSLNVLVNPVNEFAPEFIATTISLTVPEDTKYDSNYTFKMSAMDRDHGLDGMIYYSIDPGPFSINPKSGEIKVFGNLDRETQQSYVLLVRAIDKGTPYKTGTSNLIIEVTDVNDNAPVCLSSVYTVFVLEGRRAQSEKIIELQCQDDDKDPANLNNKLTYFIVSGESVFAIDQSGNIMVNANATLDYETDKRYELSVLVKDSGPLIQLNCSIKVEVLVTDENDNAPEFKALPKKVFPENKEVGSELLIVQAVDKDSGYNGIVMYTITKGDSENHFTIDKWNGYLYLTSQLDFERQRKYELEITAQDMGANPKSATGTLTISVTDVNDNAPLCNTIVTIPALKENTKNEDIAYLNCTDVDTVGQLTYSILSGSNSSYFNISSSGNISATAGADINYELTQQILLQISISDGVHTVNSFAKITVKDVNEFDPKFSSPGPSSVRVKEDVNINTILLKMNATDDDIFDMVKVFSIISGNQESKFLIDPITGNVRVFSSLDYETNNFYSLLLQVMDSGNRSSTALVNVTVEDVNDNRPTCNSTRVVVRVTERDSNKLLFTPDCYDRDTNLDPQKSYSLVSGNVSFIDFNTTTGGVYLKAAIDYETMTSHTLVINAFDSGSPDIGINITITILVEPVNEHSPIFNPTNMYDNVSISEDAPVGQIVFRVNATDQDKGLAQGTVRYYIINSDPNEYFEIDESSGDIKTLRQLDREMNSKYSLIIGAEDDLHGSPSARQSNATVIILITDVNDNTPMFNSSLYLASLTESVNSQLLVTVKATDKDDPLTKGYGNVTYTIAQGGSDFTIDAITGDIRNSHVLDADLSGKTIYTIVVAATDSKGAAGALSSTALVAVTVTTVNEFKPEFSSPSYTTIINETQYKFGDTILTFSARDNDTGKDGEFTFSFALTQSKFALVQNGEMGRVILNDYLDFEKNDTIFNFKILATDNGFPPHTGTADVTIQVNDVNDNFPNCISVLNVDRVENTSHIANLSCTDKDVNKMLTFSVVSTSPPSLNVSVSKDGVVTALSALDYEIINSYQIIIQVVDSSSSSIINTATVTINLRVSDLNDNPPTLTGPYNFTIMEDEAISNKVFYHVNASGNDGPEDYLTYSLSPSTYFAITPLNGEVTLKSAAPDFETFGPLYILTVCVMDSPNPVSFKACQNISVTITDVNDNRPVFNPAVYSASVSESAAKGTELSTKVAAYDGDKSPQFNQVTYSIIDGNSDGNFKINGSGHLSLAQILDYEKVTSYPLIIQVSDGRFTANASYFVQVLPVNEFTPTFNTSVVTFSILENTLTNYTFNLAFSASDSDSGSDGNFTYSIDSGPFKIDQGIGLLSVVENIDRERNQAYTLLIRATDKGVAPKTGTLTLSVSVLDVNDNAPTCSQTFFTALVGEGFSSQAIIAALDCQDRDLDPAQKNNAITYTITSNMTNYFELTNTGVIKVRSNTVFDREANDFYAVVVEVSDQALSNRLTTTVTAEVTIADLNDNYPIFTGGLSKTTPEDLALGSLVAVVSANDSDVGVNAKLFYSILGGNTGSRFRIDQYSGAVTLESALDYEAIKNFVLVISAYDKSQTPLTSTMSLTVSVTDVNDNPPACPVTFISTNVAENLQGILVTQVKCSDVDTVGSLAYSISSGNRDNNFRIDALGNVYVTSSAALDYETKQEYPLQVVVTDGLHNVIVSVKALLTDVNEYNPVFSPFLPKNVSVKENAIVGSLVLTLNATDKDNYDSVKRYSIIDGNSNQKFFIDSNMIIIFSPLDYEIEQSYTLRLMVQDSTLLNDTTSVNVTIEDVNDNSPVCNDSSVIVSVDENVNSRLLYTPTCTDVDSPVLVYSILSGNNSALSLNTSTGALSLQSGLDYENITSLDVLLQVSDNGSPAFFVNLSLRIYVNPVNEFPPKFNQTSYGPYSLQENVSLGANVASLTALDNDKGLLQGTVRYQIIAGDDQQTFLIGETTGVITVTRTLDRENKDSYSLIVRAVDDLPGSANQKSATTSVSISVTDINDNTPVFTTALYFLNVSESAIAGPLVELLKLTVQDSDTGINSQTDITITSGNNDKKFSINGTSLILIDSLDYETTNHYDLVLTVTDNGLPKLSSTCRVVIDVVPANDNTPLINVTTMTKTIQEDTAVGTLVFDTDASDLDKGMQGKITYGIASGVASNVFVINSVTGQLFVGSALDFDDGPKTYSIIVKATDDDTLAKRTATASLSITLTDVNDNAPVFPKSEYVFSIIENSAAGTSVGNILATDKDSGVNGQITLTLTGGSGMAYFTVNSNMELITTAMKTDYEMTKVLYLSVRATDGGTPSYTSNCLVRITVINVNDNTPTISPSNITVHILESSSVGTSVQSYFASDPDTSGVLFSLAPPNNLFFDVNSRTGLVTLKATLDREITTNHTLNIIAIDMGTPADNSTSNTAMATLLVIVDDVNDNRPVIKGTYSRTILETAGVNELILTITATDEDSGVNSDLVYAISAGNTNDSFKIDFSGNLLVAKPLNTDLSNYYTLTITVTDRGTPALFASTSADIAVKKVNHSPVFELSSYLLKVDENSPVGRTLGAISARDNDPGANGLLTYSLSQASFPYFTINSSTGVISVSSDKIDRETLAQYRGIVRATDGGLPALIASAEVVIDVNDVDDNNPMFSPASYSTTVKENLPVGTSVLQVTTNDADTPANSDVFYSIDTNLLNGSTAADFFEVSSTGVVSIKALLDYETYKELSFIVLASKPGSQLTVTASILISIADENDNSPVFQSQFINSEVDYTKTFSDIVAQVSASDRDSGDNGRLVYTLNTNTYGSLFTVDSVTGDVKMSATAVAGTKYTLVVGANDLGVPQLSSNTTVRVDAFNPVNQIIYFFLSLSKSNFQALQQTFLANLQNQLRLKYPKAVLKLWHVTERDGVASSPGSTRRKRQTTSKPVTVGVLALQDGTTNSLGNLGQEKQFLSQSELLTAFGDIASGNAGAQFNSYGIQSVKAYSEGQGSSDGWWDTVYGPIITAILIALGLILLAILIYCCCRHHNRKNHSERTSSTEEPVIPTADYSPRFFKGYRDVEFYPDYPRIYPVRLRNGDPDQFMNPYFSNKHYLHL